jgi:hypothetical protein
MNFARIAIATALLLSGGAAGAQTATDASCILVSNVFAQKSTDPDTQKLAEATLYFYLGRVGDHATAAQLKSLFDQQTKTISDANAATVMNACVKTLQSRVQLMQSLSPKPQQPQGK